MILGLCGVPPVDVHMPSSAARMVETVAIGPVVGVCYGRWLRRPLARLGGGRITMAKDQDIKKSSNKKAPQKTLKEKRAAKKAKQAEKA